MPRISYSIGVQMSQISSHIKMSILSFNRKGHLLLNLRLGHLHHHHESHQVEKHCREQPAVILVQTSLMEKGGLPVLVVLKPFLLSLTKATIPLDHLSGCRIHPHGLPLLGDCVQEDVLPELRIVPKTGAVLVHQTFKDIVATLVGAGCLRRRNQGVPVITEP